MWQSWDLTETVWLQSSHRSVFIMAIRSTVVERDGWSYRLQQRLCSWCWQDGIPCIRRSCLPSAGREWALPLRVCGGEPAGEALHRYFKESKLANKLATYMQQWHIDYFFPSGLVCFTFVFFLLEKKRGKKANRQLSTSENKQKKTTIMQLSNNKSMCLFSWRLQCSTRCPKCHPKQM